MRAHTSRLWTTANYLGKVIAKHDFCAAMASNQLTCESREHLMGCGPGVQVQAVFPASPISPTAGCAGLLVLWITAGAAVEVTPARAPNGVSSKTRNWCSTQ